MNAPRFLFIATADARGHLMRTQLLAHALQAQGAQVSVLTTSDEGAKFLADFGISAPVLSRYYTVLFDTQQNMLKRETDRRILAYMLLPWHMAKDIWKLATHFKTADVVINDSFHPALLVMCLFSRWGKKIVHVYGKSLRQALEGNFEGRHWQLIAKGHARFIAFMVDKAKVRIEHDFSAQPVYDTQKQHYALPTPIALPKISTHAEYFDLVVYLNPHFQDPALAEALENAIIAGGYRAHLVGEGYAHRPSWLSRDTDWISKAACAKMLLTAPGQAGLSTAFVFEKPLLLLVTEQPEQQRNAQQVAKLGLQYQMLVWQGQPAIFTQTLTNALQLFQKTPVTSGQQAYQKSHERLNLWVDVLLKEAIR
jgi:hypothetical protein